MSLLVVVIVAVVTAVITALLVGNRPSRGAEMTILSTPRIGDLHEALAALSSLGLNLQGPEAPLPGFTEIDLVRTVELPRYGPDLEAGFERLTAATGALFTKADQTTVQVGLRDYELTPAGRLRLFNAQLDPAKGQLFYASDEDDRVVFLTLEQVRALAARGWRFPASGTAAA